MELFLKFVPLLAIIVIGFLNILPIIIRNKKCGNSLITSNPLKKYDFKYTFTDWARSMIIFIIIFLICSMVYFILSKTLLKDAIEKRNVQFIERTLIVKEKIYPILETIYDLPIDIEFNKLITQTIHYNSKPAFRYGTYKYNIIYDNSIDTIAVEWEMRDNVIIIKTINRILGKKKENIYVRNN